MRRMLCCAVAVTGLVAPAAAAKRSSLAERAARRAYYGAPPIIPHEIPVEDVGPKVCLSCHLRGGYVAKWDAFAPLTPHPDWQSCWQCHVPRSGAKPFRGNDFAPLTPPELPTSALPGAPPPIPHEVQRRTNCTACHNSHASPDPLKSDHTERQHCRQ